MVLQKERKQLRSAALNYVYKTLDFALTECLSNSTLNIQTTGPLVNFALQKYQAQVLLSLKVISSASHPKFEPRPFRTGGVRAATACPAKIME